MTTASPQVWLGRLELVEALTDPQYHKAHFAVWATDRADIERILSELSFEPPWCIHQLTQAMPAAVWLDHTHETQQLASRVTAKNGFVLGGTYPLPSPATVGNHTVYLEIAEHELPPLASQEGIPHWDREWISSELKDLLFKQLDDQATLNTYLIVDATLRREVTKFFDLDQHSLDVPVQCLFTGDAAEALKEAAPYLIDMTLPEGAWDDKDKVSTFHKDFFAKHWGQQTGILIRTAAPFNEAWAHFRRFTKVPMQENERYVFFRFYDPRILPNYLQSIHANANKVQCFCVDNNNKDYHFIVEKSSNKVALVTPDSDSLITIPRQRFVLNYADLKPFSTVHKQKRIQRMAQRIKNDFHAELGEANIDNIETSINTTCLLYTSDAADD